MSETALIVGYVCVSLLALGPAAVMILKVTRSRFERGPVAMTYRDDHGIEHTVTVDPGNVESIGKFLARVRSHTSEAADAP